ncbi:MAG: MotE family protein [Deferrisomatales bacterium]
MGTEVRRFLSRAAVGGVLCLLPLACPPSHAQPPAALRDGPEALEARARLLEELDRQIELRQIELARQEESLAALQRALEATRHVLAEEEQKLQALRRAVEADIARRDKLVDERLERISRVYGAMRPREASLALEGMDDDLALAILERLPGRTVGRIFDHMPADRVRELTQRLEQGRSGPGQ